MDHVDVVTRSSIMASVGSKGTKPELTLRRGLHAKGYRYRLHDARLVGSPDLVFPKRKKVIFVHGCFWHRHKGCKYSTTPKSNLAFWEAKFIANVQRDHRNIAQLRKSGWKVLVVWQCELKNVEKALRLASNFLEKA